MASKITWPGAGLNNHQFDCFQIGTLFNEVAGLYIACKQLPNANWVALYVGETQSFKQRLNDSYKQHEGVQRAVKLGATHFSLMQEANPTRRLKIETELRNRLTPPANLQGVA
jgi:hypothetical protein